VAATAMAGLHKEMNDDAPMIWGSFCGVNKVGVNM